MFAPISLLYRRPFAAALVAGAALAIAASATGARAAEAGAIAPVMACKDLPGLDLTALDARIETAEAASRNGHAFCDVKGYMSPVTRFEALLPQETWKGDYLQQGCGGLCGKVDVSLDDPSRTSGYQAPYAPLQSGEMAVAADDQGHETASNADALWALDDLRLRAVFGYSSEHQLARTMKAVIRAYYGRKPAYAYFSGVSDGGHEALVLAQRYPADFDGIIAGAPANNWAPLAGLVGPWVAARNMDAEGKQILTAEKLPALHAAVMAACADKNGVIEDPRACTFDPASLKCPAGGDLPNCLTDEQIRVVRDEYRGPSDKDGHGLFDGGEPYGSELAWLGWLVMPASDSGAPADTYAAQIGLNYLNDMAFLRKPQGGYTLEFRSIHARGAQRAETAWRDLQRHRPGPRPIPGERRQDHHLSLLGGSGDSSVRQHRLLPRRGESVRRAAGGALIQPPLHDPGALPLSVRAAGRRRPRDHRAVHAATRGMGGTWGSAAGSHAAGHGAERRRTSFVHYRRAVRSPATDSGE